MPNLQHCRISRLDGRPMSGGSNPGTARNASFLHSILTDCGGPASIQLHQPWDWAMKLTTDLPSNRATLAHMPSCHACSFLTISDLAKGKRTGYVPCWGCCSPYNADRCRHCASVIWIVTAKSGRWQNVSVALTNYLRHSAVNAILFRVWIVLHGTKAQTTALWMASYEVESADLEFVYRLSDDKFHRIRMVQMLTLPLTQCRGVKPLGYGVLNHTAV